MDSIQLVDYTAKPILEIVITAMIIDLSLIT